MTLGEYIKGLRESRKSIIKNKELVKKLEITPQYWYDIENDKRIPSDYLLKNIANVLQLLDIEKIELYDLASKAHKNEKIPVDIAEYLLKNNDMKKIIREKIYKEVK